MGLRMAENKFTCVVVDDEPMAIGIIEKYITAIPSLVLLATCSNAVEAMTVLQDQPVDLIFLDIEMPHILGTDFIRTLKNAPKVIFTTAFREYAIDGFELDAVDYLLKPISFERFLKALNKVMCSRPAVAAQLSPDGMFEERREKVLFLRADRRNIRVNFDDILYIESLKDYIQVVTRDRNILTRQAISGIEKALPKPDFIRTHRSFIVAVKKVSSFSQDLIQVGKYEIPISRSYRHEVDIALRK